MYHKQPTQCHILWVGASSCTSCDCSSDQRLNVHVYIPLTIPQPRVRVKGRGWFACLCVYSNHLTSLAVMRWNFAVWLMRNPHKINNHNWYVRITQCAEKIPHSLEHAKHKRRVSGDIRPFPCIPIDFMWVRDSTGNIQTWLWKQNNFFG